MKVLVVEDYLTIAELFGYRLEALDHEMTHITGVKEIITSDAQAVEEFNRWLKDNTEPGRDVPCVVTLDPTCRPGLQIVCYSDLGVKTITIDPTEYPVALVDGSLYRSVGKNIAYWLVRAGVVCIAISSGGTYNPGIQKAGAQLACPKEDVMGMMSQLLENATALRTALLKTSTADSAAQQTPSDASVQPAFKSTVAPEAADKVKFEAGADTLPAPVIRSEGKGNSQMNNTNQNDDLFIKTMVGGALMGGLVLLLFVLIATHGVGGASLFAREFGFGAFFGLLGALLASAIKAWFESMPVAAWLGKPILAISGAVTSGVITALVSLVITEIFLGPTAGLGGLVLGFIGATPGALVSWVVLQRPAGGPK